MGRENHTPHRTIRVPESEWRPAVEKAAAEGTTVTDVIREALRRYVKKR